MNRIFVFVFLVTLTTFHAMTQTRNDAALRSVVEKDASDRNQPHKFQSLSPAEHLYRADIYSANREFSQAREHWQIILNEFPAIPGLSKALIGTGRSYMWERE